MNRPIESDYTSQVAYTRALEAYCDSLPQLEQLEQEEPVAWYDSKTGWTDFHPFKPARKPSAPDAEWLPLYTSPPAQRKPLTDEGIDALVVQELGLDADADAMNKFARVIEAAHDIKENT